MNPRIIPYLQAAIHALETASASLSNAEQVTRQIGEDEKFIHFAVVIVSNLVKKIKELIQ